MENERNVKLIIEYDGTNYHGWQIQKNSITIQGELKKALLKLTGEAENFIGAGRTDSGVHAKGQVANFRMHKTLKTFQIVRGLNAYLPEDIVVKSAEFVSNSFHSRYSAKKRIYHYHICRERTAIRRHFCWQVYKNFSLKLLNQMAKMLVGNHDFSAFSRLVVSSQHKQCIVFESHWFERANECVFRIVANRFLHGMVRTIVGTMMEIAYGKHDIEKFNEIFNGKNRLQAGPAAPAQGLILEEVIY
jgi:tRNA pseudouridine38-40 synthase